jgi:hypothetical protein
MLLLDSHIDFDYFINVRFVINSILIGEILPLITPVFVLIFLFSANKEYKCKKSTIILDYFKEHRYSFLCGGYTSPVLVV